MVQHYLHCCSYLVLTPAASLKAPQHIEKLIPQAFACVPSRITSGRQCTTALQFLGSLSKQSRVCGFVLPPQPFQPPLSQHLPTPLLLLLLQLPLPRLSTTEMATAAAT